MVSGFREDQFDFRDRRRPRFFLGLTAFPPRLGVAAAALWKASMTSSSSPVAIRVTLALITSAGYFWPRGSWPIVLRETRDSQWGFKTDLLRALGRESVLVG